MERLNKTSSNRIKYLDTLRVVACMLVLLMHAPLYRHAEFEGNHFYTIYTLIANVSSKLFFMLTGALLLPLKQPAPKFVARRLKVIVIPLIIWSAIYIIDLIFVGELSMGEIRRKIYSAPFTPVESMLWFVYAMIGMYLLMPIISKCLVAMGKRYIKYFLFLWFIASFYPYIGGFLLVPDPHHNMFSSITNFIGYIVLGYYLHRWPLPIFTKRFGLKFAIFFFIFIIVLPLSTYLIQRQYVGYTEIMQMITHDLGLNTIMTGILIFSVVQHFSPKNDCTSRIKNKISGAFYNVAIITFGTYLCHILIYRHILWPFATKYLHLPLIIDGILLATLCMIISYIIMRIIYILPFSKYIIGH